MTEHELVVFFRDRGHHQAEDVEEAADKEKVSRAIVVEDVAGQGTGCEHEECLDGRDPCDSTGRILRQRVFQIVRREYSDTVDPPGSFCQSTADKQRQAYT